MTAILIRCQVESGDARVFVPYFDQGALRYRIRGKRHRSRVLTVDTVELAELDAYHVLGAFAHRGLFHAASSPCARSDPLTAQYAQYQRGHLFAGD